MSPIISARPHKLLNDKAPNLAIELHPNKDIVGENVLPGNVRKQEWIFDFLPGPGEAIIRSEESSDWYLGLKGPAENHQKLKAVLQHQAKVWIIEPYGPHYKFRLKGTQFLIEFPANNLLPGTPAELGVPLLAAPNQIWKVI